MPHVYNPCEVNINLDSLIEEGIIFKCEDFYSLQNNFLLAQRRVAGYEAAVKQLCIARQVAKFLSRFPFVRSIAVSGSLSKYYADKDTDIDFFIITASNRLWIARTCMHILKKLSFLFGRQHYLCMNYYIDEKALEIQEKNIFTAMEIVTLLPMEGIQHFRKFIAANSWIKNYLPAANIANNAEDLRASLLRSFCEAIFIPPIAEAMDNWFMTVTARRWGRKTAKNGPSKALRHIGMSTSKHFSKPDPRNFQLELLREYENRVKRLVAFNEHVPVHR